MSKAKNHGTLRYCIDLSGHFYVSIKPVNDPYTAVFTDLFELIEFLYSIRSKRFENFEVLIKTLQNFEQEKLALAEDVTFQKEATILDNFCADLHRKKKSAHARRRQMSARKRAHLIELASDDVYLENGKLARHSGVVYRKMQKAEDNFIKGHLLNRNKRGKYIKTLNHGRKLIHQAGIYRNHVVFSAKQGTYFESKYAKAAPLYNAKCKNENTAVKPIETEEVVAVKDNKHSNPVRHCRKPMKSAVFYKSRQTGVNAKVMELPTRLHFVPLINVHVLYGIRTPAHVIPPHF